MLKHTSRPPPAMKLLERKMIGALQQPQDLDHHTPLDDLRHGEHTAREFETMDASRTPTSNLLRCLDE
jgi:hypothetical protein